MNGSLQLDTLGIMHDEIRHKHQVVEMSWFVRDGLFWTRDVLRAHADKHHTPIPHPIAIARFPDGRMMIRDGHHRCLATYIGGRAYLRHDEYTVETYTYEMYAEINFEVGFVTPFDPRTEVRVPDFTAFRQADPSKPGESAIVVVEAAEVAVDEDLIVFRIEASHFLWKMVRRLAGVLVKVGKGDVSVGEFQGLLEGRRGPKMDVAAWTAPGSGLFLEGVRY